MLFLFTKFCFIGTLCCLTATGVIIATVPTPISEAKGITNNYLEPAKNKPVKPAAVTVKIINNRYQEVGSGFIIRKDGLILTAKHVVRSVDKVNVEIGDKKYTATVLPVKKNGDADIRLIKIEGNVMLPAIELGTQSEKELNNVILAGFPAPATTYKESNKATIALAEVKDMLKVTQVKLQPGNSGGPLIKDSKVVGMAVGIGMNGEGVGISATRLAQFLQDNL